MEIPKIIQHALKVSVFRMLKLDRRSGPRGIGCQPLSRSQRSKGQQQYYNHVPAHYHKSDSTLVAHTDACLPCLPRCAEQDVIDLGLRRFPSGWRAAWHPALSEGQGSRLLARKSATERLWWWRAHRRNAVVAKFVVPWIAPTIDTSALGLLFLHSQRRKQGKR